MKKLQQFAILCILDSLGVHIALGLPIVITATAEIMNTIAYNAAASQTMINFGKIALNKQANQPTTCVLDARTTGFNAVQTICNNGAETFESSPAKILLQVENGLTVTITGIANQSYLIGEQHQQLLNITDIQSHSILFDGGDRYIPITSNVSSAVAHNQQVVLYLGGVLTIPPTTVADHYDNNNALDLIMGVN